MIIKCRRCGAILVRGKYLVNAVIFIDVDLSDLSFKVVDKGLMCRICGYYISEDKIREVIARKAGSRTSTKS